jgi:hypothetical protein
VTLVFFTDRDLGNQIFPGILKGEGVRIERHAQHFPDNTPDEEWLPVVAARHWVALSNNLQIARRPVERDAVMDSGLRLIAGSRGLPS